MNEQQVQRFQNAAWVGLVIAIIEAALTVALLFEWICWTSEQVSAVVTLAGAILAFVAFLMARNAVKALQK